MQARVRVRAIVRGQCGRDRKRVRGHGQRRRVLREAANRVRIRAECQRLRQQRLRSALYKIKGVCKY